MAIKKFNICTKRTYSKNGEEKAFWPNVGTLTLFEASGDKKAGYKLELNMFPGTDFAVFEEKPKESKVSSPATEIAPDEIPY